MCQHQSLHGNFISEFSGVVQFLAIFEVRHQRGSPEGVIRGGHRRGSSEAMGSPEGVTGGVTGGGHWRRSPEGVTGGGHRRGSSEAVIGGGHRRGSLKASIESYLLHVEFNHICLQIRFHSPQFCHENKNKLDQK